MALSMTPLKSALSLLLLLAASALAQGIDVAVVVHPDVPVDNLSFADMRRIMPGDRQFWDSSLRVTLLIRGPSPVSATSC